ncbi:MAG: DUF642 domain-containing protein, partial [Gammaproteobacteria bacterium]|nr:DUF642 domain-containing protein [Gammaproteobacteria bacterium]
TTNSQGTGGALQATGSTTVTITAVNDAPVLSQPELVTNGTFDTDLSNWTTTGRVTAELNSLRFGGGNIVGPHTASQSITTVAGGTYELTFDYRDDSSARNQSLQVSVDGSSNLLTTGEIVTDIAGNTFARYTYSFTADSSSATITFTDTSDTSGLASGTVAVDGFLDNISIQYTSGVMGEVAFTEGAAAEVLDADVTISDAELDALNGGLGNYNGASVTLVRNGGISTEDVFSFNDGNGITLSGGNLVKNSQVIAKFDIATTPGQLLITFEYNGVEYPTSADVDNILRQTTYANSSDTPPASVQIDWTFDDGDAGGALQATGSTTVTITAVNDLPTAANNTVATNEDNTYTFTAADFGYSDPDSDPMASVEITTLETVGALQLSGVDVTLNQVISKADIDAGNLKFVPVADANGTGYDSFGFSVNDGTADSASTYTMTIDVTSLNDAPSFLSPTGDGIVTTATGSGADKGRAVTVQSDGKILVAGYSHNGSDYDFALTRYNADGTLDTSFGGGDGVATTAVGSADDYAQKVALQSDGKILVSGSSWNGTDYEFAVVRYNADGTLDTSFDTDGKVTVDLTAGDDDAYGMAVQDDGKILVSGTDGNLDFTVVRINTDGSLDTSFDTDGIVTIDFPYGGSDFGDQVFVQSDGKILLSGRADASAGNADFALARLNSDGSLDTSFGGGDGMVTTPISGSHDMGI